MRLQFSVEYFTNWGEYLQVNITLTDTKGREESRLYTLETRDGKLWTADVLISSSNIDSFNYHYCLYKGDTCIRKEWTGIKRKFRADGGKDFIFPDSWRDIPSYSYLYTSAFTECIMPDSVIEYYKLPYFNGTLILTVEAPQLQEGQQLAILGNIPALGDWNKDFAFRMKKTGIHEWSISLSTAGITFPFEYKYVVTDASTGDFIAWEEGPNRVQSERVLNGNDVLVITDEPLRMPEPRWKGAGVVIPVFSLRSDGSAGVGDFGDLAKMVDWAVQTNMRVIQILPIYDTTIGRTWRDSYPYNSISIYALHPQYIDLRQLPELEDDSLRKSMEEERLRLNALPEVDYEAVMRFKSVYLQKIFAQEGKKTLSSSEFKEFFAKNDDWLVPYAAFCVLRDRYSTANFSSWPEHSEFVKSEILNFCSPASSSYAEVSFYYYIQFILHCQLLRASTYARSNEVIIKGDIPIGISRDSVEAWVEPHYFNINGQAGAPPDDFSKNGQNWGFPTYNWPVMFQDGCRWWVKRFRKMAEYFDAYRIDHVLGFFRIWEIPSHSVHGLLGQFSPALPLTVEEIESYGLHFRKEYFTRPYISDRVIYEIFGEKEDYVKDNFLNALGYDWYEMKPEFDTQRKVQAYFADKESEWDIRDGLYSLISNVLFVPDHNDPKKYHPRISASQDYLYDTLSESEQRAFDCLYEDFYYHRHNQFWYEQAMRKLPMLIESTSMLVCAEDLGMVPQCVPWVMEGLHILSLEIQTMPKGMGARFGSLEKNPYLSVATIFTHDMPTLRGWWEEDAERRQAYYNEMLQKDGKAPEIMPAWLCEEVVARHLYSPSMLCLISWQDWMSTDDKLRNPDVNSERINVPSNPNNYWHYRMHISIDKLLQCSELNSKIRMMIECSGRNK